MRINVLGVTVAMILSVFISNTVEAATRAHFCGEQRRECVAGCPWIVKQTSQTIEGCKQVCTDRHAACLGNGCFHWIRKSDVCEPH